jgi:hypothetical protein
LTVASQLDAPFIRDHAATSHLCRCTLHEPLTRVQRVLQDDEILVGELIDVVVIFRALF